MIHWFYEYIVLFISQNKSRNSTYCGLGGLVVSALDMQAQDHGFEPRSGQEPFQPSIQFQTFSTPILSS